MLGWGGQYSLASSHCGPSYHPFSSIFFRDAPLRSISPTNFDYFLYLGYFPYSICNKNLLGLLNIRPRCCPSTVWYFSLAILSERYGYSSLLGLLPFDHNLAIEVSRLEILDFDVRRPLTTTELCSTTACYSGGAAGQAACIGEYMWVNRSALVMFFTMVHDKVTFFDCFVHLVHSFLTDPISPWSILSSRHTPLCISAFPQQ